MNEVEIWFLVITINSLVMYAIIGSHRARIQFLESCLKVISEKLNNTTTNNKEK